MHSFISHNFCNYFSINTYLQQLEVPLVLLVALFAFLTEFFPFELFAEFIQFAHQLDEFFRVDGSFQIKVEHEFKFPFRQGTGFQFGNIDPQGVHPCKNLI